MRTIKRTNAFKRDYRREKRGQYREILNQDLEEVLELLIADAIMPEQTKIIRRGGPGDVTAIAM